MVRIEDLSNEQIEIYRNMCSYQDNYIREETHWTKTVSHFSEKQVTNQLELTNLEFADVLHLFIDRN